MILYDAQAYVFEFQILHFFNTPPGLEETHLLDVFNSKEVPPTAVRMFPLKTERSSSGLIEFPNVADAVLAIMKCNHIPIESKGTLMLSSLTLTDLEIK